MRQIKMSVDVVRKSDELGIIWGYASVSEVLDLQGDVVPWQELVRAVYQFMEDYYAGAASIKENHAAAADAVLVESSLQMLGGNPAWFVGVKLLSSELLEAARAGKISGFSIGGYAMSDEGGVDG